jgi:hypothetical protein
MGAGTIHHIAWRVPDDAAQRRVADVLRAAGVAPTQVMDRQYFRSIYFRIPTPVRGNSRGGGQGGVLFEIATDGPRLRRRRAPRVARHGPQAAPAARAEAKRNRASAGGAVMNGDTFNTEAQRTQRATEETTSEKAIGRTSGPSVLDDRSLRSISAL